MTSARQEVWSELRRYRIWNLRLAGLSHRYLNIWNSFSGSELIDQWKKLTQLFYGDTSILKDQDSLLSIDSSKQNQKFAVSMNWGMKNLSQEWTKNCKGELIYICFPTLNYGDIEVVIGGNDNLHGNIEDDDATFLGYSLRKALEEMKMNISDVWNQFEPQTLFHAKIFDGLSLKQIAKNLDLKKSFNWRENLHKEIFCQSLETSGMFTFRGRYFDIMRLSVEEGWSRDLLLTLDKIALRLASTEAGSRRTSRLASTLAMTADLLGAMANNMGGLRSGPSHNKDFLNSFQLLESGNIIEGIEELIKSRDLWLDRPTRIIRAARHYEGIVQMFIRHTVLSARDQIKVGMDNEVNFKQF